MSEFLSAPVKFHHLVFFQFVRQLQNKTHGRVLSWFWLLLEPIAVVLMMSIVFPLIFSFRTEDYIVYLMSGLIAWNTISSSMERGSASIRGRLNTISKVNVPIFVFIAATTMELIFYLLLSLLVFLIITFLAGYEVFFNFSLFVYALLLVVMSTYATIYIIGYVALILPDIQNVISLLVRGLFFLTPIIYPINRIPENYQFYMEFNLVHQFIRLFRYAIYYNDLPSENVIYTPLVITLTLLVLALILSANGNAKFFRYLDRK